MKHFKNPVSMRVTEEQFERDLRKPLEELGAEFVRIDSFNVFPILASNSSGEDGFIENFNEDDKLNHNRHFIETYDPEQFLAICKLEVEMKVGECYTVVSDDSKDKIGYLLENNVHNSAYFLTAYFKGVNGGLKEKDEWCYSSSIKSIRLSTPEEKAKLDKVISEHENKNMTITLDDGTKITGKGNLHEHMSNSEKVYIDGKEITHVKVNDAIIIIDSEPKPKPINVIEKVKSDLKKAKKQVKLLTEVLKYLENN